jgi:hypothetical protein
MSLALVFATGFAAMWWRTSAAHVPIMSDVHDGSTDARLASHGRHAGGEASRKAREVPRTVALPMAPRAMLASAATDPAAIRASCLPEWMLFRYEHPHLAFPTEMVVREALNAHAPLDQVVRACSRGTPTTASKLTISARITIQGRDIYVDGLGCDRDASQNGQLCDCLLDSIPPELAGRVPLEVSENNLVSYDGMLSLSLWRL